MSDLCNNQVVINIIFSTIFVAASPILFRKSCELLGKLNVFNYEPLWFCKQSFFIYSAHIFCRRFEQHFFQDKQ